jgi:hypothetical protein
LGGFTVGLLARGPLVGVLAEAVVGVVGVAFGVVSPFTCGTELASDSLPTVIVLELLDDPQPATRATTPSVARMAPRRPWECLGGCEGMKFITAGSLTHRGCSRYDRPWTVLGGDVAAP